MKRYLHNKSHYHNIATRMGYLVPVSGFETIPGDTVQIQNMMMMRLSPPATPVMHPVNVHFINYFVPNRILDPKDGSFSWENFITGGEDGSYDVPPPRAEGVNIAKGTVMEHFGIQPGTRSYNTFLAKAYASIWNNDFRDQQLQAEIDIDTYDGSGLPLRVAWERDYFTAARPEPQLGEDTLLPLGVQAPVATQALANGSHTISVLDGAGVSGRLVDNAGTVAMDTAAADGSLYADLTAATAASVRDIREAFAIQRYKEARNLYGSRYTEYLRYLGISSSDARLQRPERISGGRSTINFSEVLQTTDGAETPLGKLGGHGIAGLRSRKARYFCEEHGHVVTLMYVRPRTMYANSQHRQFDRFTKEDYWQRELQEIGQEEIYAREVYADAADPDAVFGWGPRYESFKRVPSRVSGDFRDTLSSWHLARDFGQEPVLNGSFVECVPSDRIFVDQSDSDKLWCTVRNRVAVRSMLRKGISGRAY